MIESNKVEIGDFLDNYENGFLTPYADLNESMQGGLKKGTSYLFAGMPKTGLTYFISSLIKKLVVDVEDMKVLHFSFNDTPVQRKMRLALNHTKTSLTTYRKEELLNAYNYFSEKDIEYNEGILSTTKMLEILYNYVSRTGPTVVVIEDIFNIQKENEKNDFDLAQKIVELINALKKHNFISICSNRFNGKIEEDLRVFNPKVHYPVRNDIYNGNYIYNAFNNVYAFHRPKFLNIPYYGVDKRGTDDLVHIRKLLTSEGTLKNIWLKNVLKNGHFEQENNKLKM